MPLLTLSYKVTVQGKLCEKRLGFQKENILTNDSSAPDLFSYGFKVLSIILISSNASSWAENIPACISVTHRKYGSGVITAMDDTNVTILFDDIEKVFDMKVLFQNKLIE